MQKYAVIGLGNFGYSMAETLIENNCEVLGIDIRKDLVQKYYDRFTMAVAGDASNRQFLETLSLEEYDGVIVSLGQYLAPSMLITLNLKELEIQRIIVRALSEDHAKILKLMGIEEIVFPERDMAIRLGSIVSMRNALDYLPLSEDYVILEVEPPEHFIGQTLRELKLATDYSIQVIGFKKKWSTGRDEIRFAPLGDMQVRKDEFMIVLGKEEDVRKLEEENK
jgi:trk system potassium uptake protein TrkA